MFIVAHCKRKHAPAVVRREWRVRLKEERKIAACSRFTRTNRVLKLDAVGRDVPSEQVDASPCRCVGRHFDDNLRANGTDSAAL